MMQIQTQGKKVFQPQEDSAQNTSRQQVRHNLIIENRSSLTATGIRQVISYDEFSATVLTDLGTLVVGGKNLKVSELSCHSGELKVSGEIEYIQYEEKRERRGGLLSRLAR